MESRYTWKNQLINAVRNFSIIGGIIVVLAYLIIISNRAAQEEWGEMVVSERSEITRIEEPVVYGYEDGAKIWELRSEFAEEESETESSDLTRIYELILFKGGYENVRIRGDQGHWDKPREKLTLTGNVEVESADGTTLLDTEILIWEEQTKTLVCPDFVDFWVEDNHVTANSLYSADDLATIDFIGNVDMFVVGLEGANFVTREGDFPLEDIEGERESDGINVLAQFVHYDKGDKLADCYPEIPLNVQLQYSLDSEGRALPEQSLQPMGVLGSLTDPVYLESLQQSIARMDLTPQEQAFLRGEIDNLQGPWEGDEETSEPGLTPEEIRSRAYAIGIPSSEIASLSIQELEELVNARYGESKETQNPAIVQGPVTVPLLPIIPVRKPEDILTVADYSFIEGWQISPNLNAELFENDPGFDPYTEQRDGFVFAYRFNRKMWCEELHINLGEHTIDALRRVDARFKDLRDPDREPPEGRVARAIQESPTQIISNYLVHNWRENVTEGYGRVLAIQAEKDIEADNIVYYENSDVIHGWGNVMVHQYSGQWWETSGAIEDVEDERAREDVRNPSVVTSDAILSYAERVSWAYGNVVFRQEEQVVNGDRGQYEEDTDILVMAGNVNYNNEDGEQLRCALLTMDLEMEEYIAEGAAIARNIVPEEYREDRDEMRDDENRKPEDDARMRLLENRTAFGFGDWTEAIVNPPPAPPPIEVLQDMTHRTTLPTNEEIENIMGPEVTNGSTGEAVREEEVKPDSAEGAAGVNIGVTPLGSGLPGQENIIVQESGGDDKPDDTAEAEENAGDESSGDEESGETVKPEEEEQDN